MHLPDLQTGEQYTASVQSIHGYNSSGLLCLACSIAAIAASIGHCAAVAARISSSSGRGGESGWKQWWHRGKGVEDADGSGGGVTPGVRTVDA